MALKDLFFKPDEDVSTQTNVNEAKPKIATAVVEQPKVNTEAPNISIHGNIPQNVASSSISADEGIVNKIWNAIIAANRPGPDYLELKNNVDALDSLPVSNEQKIIASFKILKKNYPNFKKEDITNAIDFYIGIVNDEKKKGLDQLAQLKSEKVDKAEADIEEMKKKADGLKNQYDELMASINTKNVELAQSRNEIEMNNNIFNESVNSVLNVLNSDKVSINNINFE